MVTLFVVLLLLLAFPSTRLIGILLLAYLVYQYPLLLLALIPLGGAALYFFWYRKKKLPG